MIVTTQEKLSELRDAVGALAFGGGHPRVRRIASHTRGRRGLPLDGRDRFVEVPGPDGVYGFEVVLSGLDEVEARVLVYASSARAVFNLVDALGEKTRLPVRVLAARSGCALTTTLSAGPGARVSRVAFGVAGTVATVLKSGANGHVVSAAHVIAGGTGPYIGECLALDGRRNVPLEQWANPTTSMPATATKPDAGVAGPRSALVSSGVWPDGSLYRGERNFAGAKGPFMVFPYRVASLGVGIAVAPTTIAASVVLSGVTYKDVVGMKIASGSTIFWSGDSGAPLRDGDGFLVGMLVGRLGSPPTTGVFTPWEHVRALLASWGVP